MPIQPPKKQFRELLEDELRKNGLDPEMPMIKSIKEAMVEANESMDKDFDRLRNVFATHQDFPRQCNHSWKNYYGFSECYQFCEHCPEKREIPQ